MRLLASVLCAAFAAASYVSIGLQLPFDDSLACVEGWQYFHIARTAARFIETTDWWRATGLQLRLEVLPSSDPYTAWQSAEAFALRAAPTCTHDDGSDCRVFRAGIVGPADSDATALVKLVTKSANMPHMSYSSTGVDLTPSAYKKLAPQLLQPFYRVTYTNEVLVGGLWAFIKQSGWKIFSVLHARDENGDENAVLMQDAVQRDGTSTAAVWSIASFDSGDKHSIDKALESLEHDSARIIVLFASSNDAALVMQRAFDLGMTGKGWTWLGGDWVREFTWILASRHPDFAAAERPSPLPAPKLGDGGVGVRRLSEPSGPLRNEKKQEKVGPGSPVYYLSKNPDHPVNTGAAVKKTDRRASAASSWWGPSSKSSSLTVPSTTQKVMKAMQGVVGMVPYRIPPDSTLGGFLDRFKPEQVADPAYLVLPAAGAFPPPTLPTEEECFLFYNAPLTTVGLPLDSFGPYVFNAVHSIAAAVASVLTDTKDNTTVPVPFSQLNTSAIAALLTARGSTLPSPLTETTMHWLGNGDRSSIAMSLANVQGEKIVTVGAWDSFVRPGTWDGNNGTVLAPGVRMSDGRWVNQSTIIWPADSKLVPPDRALEHDSVEATALVVALIGIILSLLAGAVLHHAHVTVLPESAATVLIGAGFGVLIRFMLGVKARETAGFSVSMFMLVLLPIIIFESGYSLEKRTFFSQLFSICAFAIGGTLISTFVIGWIVYYVGAAGSIMSLSYEEAMSFASLLSATDPVATLAVFSSLRVHPMLNALVYGEAVINDAVAIVLYRTFTGFLVTEITTNAVIWAVGTFLGIMIFSVLLGLIVAMLATLAFRYVNITGEGREVRWEKELAAKVNAMRKFVPKIRLNLGGETATAPSEDAHSKPEPEAEHAGDNVDLASGIKETSILLLFAYVSFALAEAISLSGIVAALICGIAMNHYTRSVMTRDGKVTSAAFFKMLAGLADTAVFFQIGLNVVLNFGLGDYNMGFIIWTMVACLVARAANIFPIAWLLNKKRSEPISTAFQIQMWHAGLRGAIAFATSLAFPSQNKDTIVNATSWICLFTTFALGGTTTTLLNILQIPYNVVQTSADRKELVATSLEEHRAKKAMAWLDKWIRRIVYGKSFLREMEYANAVAEQKVRLRMAQKYGITLPADAIKPIPPPKDEDDDENFRADFAARGVVVPFRPEPDSGSESDTDSDYGTSEPDKEQVKDVFQEEIISGGTGLLAFPGAASHYDSRPLVGAEHAPNHTHAHNIPHAHSKDYRHGTHVDNLATVVESPLISGDDAVIFGDTVQSPQRTTAAENLTPAHTAPVDPWELVEAQQEADEAAKGLLFSSMVALPPSSPERTGVNTLGHPSRSLSPAHHVPRALTPVDEWTAAVSHSVDHMQVLPASPAVTASPGLGSRARTPLAGSHNILASDPALVFTTPSAEASASVMAPASPFDLATSLADADVVTDGNADGVVVESAWDVVPDAPNPFDAHLTPQPALDNEVPDPFADAATQPGSPEKP